MEAVEESQVNDRTIMERTVIEQQDHSGRIRFRTTLPSGRDLESEWIQASDKSKAGILWAEAVRGQIVADSQESAAVSRRALKERQAAQPVVPKFVGPDGQPLASSGLSTPVVPPLPSQTPATLAPAPSAAPADPGAYVKAQHTAARQRLDELKAEKERISFDYAQAQKAEAQWFGLMQAMGVGSTLEQVGSNLGAVRNGVGSDSGSVIVSTNIAYAVADTDDDGE